MIIKFQDKFESIFYAVLYSNLTAYFLFSKNEPDNLFSNEEVVNIDNLNWLEVLTQHNNKYGEIKWFDDDYEDFRMFKKNIEICLLKKEANKYSFIIAVIKIAIKYGLNDANNQLTKLKQSKIKIKRTKSNKAKAKQKILLFEIGKV